MSVITGQTPSRRLPAEAQRLRQPLHARAQSRMRERWGFDLDDVDASRRADTLLSERPSDADRLVLAASVHSSRGDDAAALEVARRAVASAPGSSRAHTTLSAVLAAAGDLSSARQEADAAVTLDADDPAARYNRGVLAWLAGERQVARQDFAVVRAAIDPGEGGPRTSFWRTWWPARRARRTQR